MSVISVRSLLHIDSPVLLMPYHIVSNFGNCHISSLCLSIPLMVVHRTLQRSVSKEAQSVPKKLIRNCVRISINKCISIPPSIVQYSNKREETCNAVTLDIDMALVNFEYRSVITSLSCLLLRSSRVVPGAFC